MDNLDESENARKRWRTVSPDDCEIEESLNCDDKDEPGEPMQQKNIEDYFECPNPSTSAVTECDVKMNFMGPMCDSCHAILDEDDAMVQYECAFCSKDGCLTCIHPCFMCSYRFCCNCSLVNYDYSYERWVCIDCNCTAYG